MEINPLSLMEKEYILLILQYLHLNPTGRTFEQICSSIEKAPPSEIKARLTTLDRLGLVFKTKGEDTFEILYALTKRGRYASELVWDLFRIIINPRDNDDENTNVLDFYR